MWISLALALLLVGGIFWVLRKKELETQLTLSIQREQARENVLKEQAERLKVQETSLETQEKKVKEQAEYLKVTEQTFNEIKQMVQTDLGVKLEQNRRLWMHRLHKAA